MKHISAVLMAGILMPAVTLAAEHAKDLSKKEIHHLIQTASTPAEHNQLAQHYRLQADKLEVESKDHAEMAKMYRAHPNPVSETKRMMNPDTAAHCDYFAESLHKASVEALALSTAHADMARK